METVRHLAAHLGLDLIAVGLLTFAIYYPRHRRRDLVPAYLALNVALFTVVAALAEVGGNGGLALGFGLFGVLSIIRLRSDAVQHEEVAYYFTTLVLGLVCGLPHLAVGLAAALSAILLLVVYGADHPRLYARSRRSVITLDTVHADPAGLRADLARRLGEPLHWTVMEIDYVRDLTVVDVRYREPEPGTPPQAATADRPVRQSAAPSWETV
ncbi:DUF4956 domain-containing protein [Streptomyces griseocarneus]|uniref:DUF4956 domain-containing protein n=1 Tax=Streptomyces griseocarneus TaxID=51201 RepID=UPI00167DBA71|nr:DUF4956 domain-containing protein [Streptomyces griseocarneus]MBZ6472308.1 DUF4956 domain-containing protein [Streptomyces griseocarneus]GHG72704.1 DUF4956 domain-containing protein [Streptomyces griseocarneus]